SPASCTRPSSRSRSSTRGTTTWSTCSSATSSRLRPSSACSGSGVAEDCLNRRHFRELCKRLLSPKGLLLRASLELNLPGRDGRDHHRDGLAERDVAEPAARELEDDARARRQRAEAVTVAAADNVAG